MGKHADPDEASFYRSLGRAVVRSGVVAGVLLVVVVSMAWSALRDSGGDAETAVLGARITPEPAERGGPEPEPGEDRTPEPATKEQDSRPAKPPAQTSVQVLDGVGDARLTQGVVDTLRGMGYEIVAVNPSANDYAVTTVFYTQGYRAEADALLGSDPRFAKKAPNPDLAESVDLHVVIGANWEDQAR